MDRFHDQFNFPFECNVLDELHTNYVNMNRCNAEAVNRLINCLYGQSLIGVSMFIREGMVELN